jgi:hypothetical protein
MFRLWTGLFDMADRWLKASGERRRAQIGEIDHHALGDRKDFYLSANFGTSAGCGPGGSPAAVQGFLREWLPRPEPAPAPPVTLLQQCGGFSALSLASS